MTRWCNEFIKKNFKPQIVENVSSFNTNLWPHKDKQTITTSKRVKTTMAKNDYKWWEKIKMHIKFKKFKENLMKNWGGDAENLMKNWRGDACQNLKYLVITMKKIERHKDPSRRWHWHWWKIEFYSNNNEIK